MPARPRTRCRLCTPGPAGLTPPFLFPSFAPRVSPLRRQRLLPRPGGELGRGLGRVPRLDYRKFPPPAPQGTLLGLRPPEDPKLGVSEVPAGLFHLPGSERVVAVPLLNGRGTGVGFSRDKRNPAPPPPPTPGFPRLRRRSVQPRTAAPWVLGFGNQERRGRNAPPEDQVGRGWCRSGVPVPCATSRCWWASQQRNGRERNWTGEGAAYWSLHILRCTSFRPVCPDPLCSLVLCKVGAKCPHPEWTGSPGCIARGHL